MDNASSSRKRAKPVEDHVFDEDALPLEEQIEVLTEERDNLEMQVHELTNVIIDLMLGRVQPFELAQRFAGVEMPNLPRHEYVKVPSRARPIVYYIRMNGRVKIGTTTNIVSRMSAFSAQPADLLAFEPGGHDVEHARHLQFQSSRKPDTELFGITDELRRHIRALREGHTQPYSDASEYNGLAA